MSGSNPALLDDRALAIQAALRGNRVPASAQTRLAAAREGRLPWLATLTPAELLSVRSHGLRPISAVSATCWMHYGWSWTEGHGQGWATALRRLKLEAMAAGGNAVVDVKMRTLPLGIANSMDFTLVGTAVFVDGLPPSPDPIVATVPALEFVKLLEADVVPTGIAVGAHYEFLNDWRGATNKAWAGNTEVAALSRFWEQIRQRAHAKLRQSAAPQGNGVLAHVNFGQLFEVPGGNNTKRYLGRQIVVATTVDTGKAAPFHHDIKMVMDIAAGKTPLTGRGTHHQSYAANQTEGAI
jgi:hypothetical protein